MKTQGIYCVKSHIKGTISYLVLRKTGAIHVNVSTKYRVKKRKFISLNQRRKERLFDLLRGAFEPLL